MSGTIAFFSSDDSLSRARRQRSLVCASWDCLPVKDALLALSAGSFKPDFNTLLRGIRDRFGCRRLLGMMAQASDESFKSISFPHHVFL